MADIVQMIPAPGWWALMKNGPDKPLVCWALVKLSQTGTGRVEGLAIQGSSVKCVLDDDDFQGYCYDSKSLQTSP